jgi:hypothetical protein
VTVVLVDDRHGVATMVLVDAARRHRPRGPQDDCCACDVHWPCPTFFGARRDLIAAGVPVQLWVPDA